MHLFCACHGGRIFTAGLFHRHQVLFYGYRIPPFCRVNKQPGEPCSLNTKRAFRKVDKIGIKRLICHRRKRNKCCNLREKNYVKKWKRLTGRQTESWRASSLFVISHRLSAKRRNLQLHYFPIYPSENSSRYYSNCSFSLAEGDLTNRITS